MSNVLKMLSRGGAVGEATDEHFENTVLLLHGDGTNGAQNNTFLDASTNNFTITRNGNTTQGTFSPFSKPDGRWGVYFGGSDSRLTISTISLSGDFCIEAWIYVESASETQPMIVGGSGTTGSANHQFRCVTASGAVGLVIAGTQVIADSGTAVTVNAWHHVVACRSGTDCALFVDGARQGTGTSSSTFAAEWVGDRNAAAYSLVGYMSNLRIVKGASVYDPTSSSLTVPTGPLSDITDTDILTCSLNRFADASAAGATVTPTGTVRVTPFSPFPITTAYDPAVNGGAGYFDGSGDYLRGNSSMLGGASISTFTIEGWVYPTAFGATRYIIGDMNPTANTNDIAAGINSTGQVLLFWYDNNTKSAVSTDTVKLNAWNYFAIRVSSNSISIYVNSSVASALSGTTTLTNRLGTTNFTIGQFNNGNNLTGYVSNIRVSTVARTISVPTTLLTSDANTRILTNFTNAGIFDNTGFNALETVGNAQIDTSVKKYGTGSMEFDGTDDHLVTRYTTDIDASGGNFTIECWINTNSVSGERGIIGIANSSSTTGLVLRTSNNKVQFWVNGFNNVVSQSTTITTGTWYHVALVRNGSTNTLYVDGVSVGSNSQTPSIGTPATVVIGRTYANSAIEYWNGYIDDLRITKGIARYTSNFTPPDKSLPDIGE
jgi:hypothetical protein